MGGAHCPLFVMVGWEGLEPSTNALKGRCSTIELSVQKDTLSTLYGEGMHPLMSDYDFDFNGCDDL